MEPQSKWAIIFTRYRRKQLPLDIEHCSPIALRNIILDVHTPDSLLERIAHAYSDNEDTLKELVRCPNLSETTLAFIALTASDEIKKFIAGPRVVDVVMGDEASAAGKEGEKKRLNLTQLVLKMSPSQKIKLALTGAKDARGLLVRESSKIIALSVLGNPRLTIGEVESFAKSQNLSEDVIRKIGTNAEWTRKPTIMSALVFNPKTPVGISVGFVGRLSERDLDILEKNLTSLKVDYERFFTGDLKTPPVAARKKVDEILRRVGNAPVDRAAEQFRLQTLQSRYTALTELWDKRVSAKEEGRGLFRVARPAPPPSAARPKGRSVAADGESSASVKAVGRGDLKSLFDRFCAARAAIGEDVTKLRYDRFEDLVKKQAAEIRRRTGATRLAFEVQTRDGKVRLVGKPLPAPAKGTP